MDITPLIDVLFMLIIFFVLTASFVQGKLDVNLPQGEGESADTSGAIVVTIDADKKIFWDGREIDKESLAHYAASSRDREILVAGDKETSYGEVASLLSLLRGEGVKQAGLLLAQESDK